ncbi:cupin domain-containing protein [Polymorphobacter multimanifer]|nr:cupin domain-containing protein [Polymorphobacter multimanifer]
MVIVDERETMVREAPPHGGAGMSTAWRISDSAPGRTMEFRKRALDNGASIGLHVLGHDEVYYVVSGQGDVTSDGSTSRIGPGMAAYLYAGADVGIAQKGGEPLVLIIAYPVVK